MRVKLLKFITQLGIGGTERQFVYLAKELDRSLFDVRVGCLERKGEFLKDIDAMRLPISEYRITSLYNYRSIQRRFRLARDIRREGIHLVHAYGFYPNLFSIPAARLAGNCVTVASVRDIGAFTNRKKLRGFSQRIACAMADCVVANSGAVRDWLVSLGLKEDHIRVIPNGIAIPEWSKAPLDFPIRRELGIDPAAPVVAVICRLIPGKGLEYFLEAAARVSARLPSARFLIVGSAKLNPSYRQTLERYAEQLQLGERVIFTGERNDVPRLLSEANLSALPSLSEGLSNALLEAMAAGLPVVATRVGGNVELVRDGEHGFLVPPRDALALGDAMVRILESPAMARQFGEDGRLRAAEDFSLESTVRRTQDLYLTLLDQRRRESSGGAIAI
jgi:glycosyltransferase involved in cell wall biosynthesis